MSFQCLTNSKSVAMKELVSARSVIVIPARYGSTRFPGKPLADICGKPMIQHVYERALQVPNIGDVIIAVDDPRVSAAVASFGGKYIMTSAGHVSGTDRLVEVMNSIEAEIYINVQGDEPLFRPTDVQKLTIAMSHDPNIQVGTLCHTIGTQEAVDPNCVKVVLSNNGDALYFSRSPIPYQRQSENPHYLKHIGIYAYRRTVLSKYSELSRPLIERIELLEQLRLLNAGIPIRTYEVKPTAPGVDTPEDLENVCAILGGKNNNSLIKPSQIDLVITDVDGVLTDGSLYYGPDGECLKRFNVRDGLGIRLLEECGCRVAFLSGRDSSILRKRVEDLGVTLYKFGVRDKSSACLDIIKQAGVRAENTAFLGDDSIDLPAFGVCGLSYAVADAPSYIKSQASFTLESKGGEGAFRELADSILMAKGRKDVLESSESFLSSIKHISQ